MTDETKGAVAGAANAQTNEVKATEVKKTGRRGIGSARGTQRLKFNHTDAIPQNGLFLGHLESVVVGKMQIGEDKAGTPSFNGMEVPKLVLTFVSNDVEVSKRKYVTLQFTPVESNVDTIPGGKFAWQVDSLMDWLKHLMNVYVLKGRELTEDEEIALSLPYEDFDNEGAYVPVEPEVVIAGWKSLFENFENIFNRGKEGSPVYKTKDGKDLVIWMKLLRFTKVKGEWRPVVSGNNAGDLGFIKFVGEGCIELHKNNTIPTIHINSISETITPKEIAKPKTPNMAAPGIPGGSVPMMGGIPAGGMDGTNYGSEINLAAAEDLPF